MTVHFGSWFQDQASGNALLILPDAVPHPGDGKEITNLGVAVEGVGVAVKIDENERLVTRITLGRDDRFRFYRDKFYDAQTYMRARGMEKGVGTRQGESGYVPQR